jgi:hypothetical protein
MKPMSPSILGGRLSFTGGIMRGSITLMCAGALVAALLIDGIVQGAEPKGEGEASFSEKVGHAAKKIGKKIEEGFTKTAKKLEDKHVPEKVEQKFKKAADKTAEGFGKAERKVKQKLAD